MLCSNSNYLSMSLVAIINLHLTAIQVSQNSSFSLRGRHLLDFSGNDYFHQKISFSLDYKVVRTCVYRALGNTLCWRVLIMELFSVFLEVARGFWRHCVIMYFLASAVFVVSASILGTHAQRVSHLVYRQSFCVNYRLLGDLYYTKASGYQCMKNEKHWSANPRRTVTRTRK